MSRPEWTPLWEDDEARQAAYFAASAEERAEMCEAYEEYLQNAYGAGRLAVAASSED